MVVFEDHEARDLQKSWSSWVHGNPLIKLSPLPTIECPYLLYTTNTLCPSAPRTLQCYPEYGVGKVLCTLLYHSTVAIKRIRYGINEGGEKEKDGLLLLLMVLAWHGK